MTEQKLLDLSKNCYLIVEHDDEVIAMTKYNTLEDVKKHLREVYAESIKEDLSEISDERLFVWHFDESSVDGDSYRAYNLMKVEKGVLTLVRGHVELTND